jgi:lipoprotein-anchoring transpeptidase ErfK/SrfK
LVVCLLMAAICAQAASATAGPRVAAHQTLVALLSTHDVHDRPNGTKIGFVPPNRPLTGERTVLPVLGQTTDKHKRTWLRVRLPGRTLGGSPPPRTGWIKATNTLRSTTTWHIVVHLDARRVDVYHNAHRLFSYPAIVGKPSTPTPTGEYFVEENVRMPPNAAGAPFALATSDRSNVLQEFDGGPGQIALHGLDNVGGQLGTAESHGCIRLADYAITWLADRIGPGVPITIT